MNDAEPAVPERLGLAGGLQLAFAFTLALALLALPGLAWWPLAFVFPTLIGVGMLYSRYRDRQIADARSGEGICEFARSFDRNEVDTWIIRAAYQELSTTFPVRATDNLYDHFGACDEDVDDIVTRIAERAGRSMDGWEENPVREVQTVLDVVTFLQNQPLVSPPDRGP